ncbi:MAG: hypothetical protein COZ47_00530 [Lysobacterales bacterium CG_4_10_14_3_um_filter_64_11]|nr:MAG: hypothetical protein COZ47_00530 [Xanthomonadales bacterium CG_4_10_14_3_um_filter_64_11]
MAASAQGQEMISDAVLSPCIGVCELDGAGYCVGCHRSSDEIAGWLGFSPHQRQHLMDNVLPGRERRQGVRGTHHTLVWADAIQLGLRSGPPPRAAKGK